jgi:two-component system response regulator AtoC
MNMLERELSMIAGQPVPVILVAGETGAGKAVLARRLHVAAGRDGDFVQLNVAAVPESLIESELFGYERGAFSDARERKPGLVDVAEGGTLFLDEIGELSPAVQAKLLGFLDGFSFRRLGATAMQSVDVRVVAATNRDLKALVDAGRFRADLYFRLSSVMLRVPPLRERGADLLPLAEHFVGAAAQRYGKRCRGVSPEAATALDVWPWPGNVRELKGVIDRAVLMNDGARLELEHLPSELLAAAVDPVPAALRAPEAALPTLDEIEVRYMRAVLALVGGNKVRAAERLGITRQTLAKRLGESE